VCVALVKFDADEVARSMVQQAAQATKEANGSHNGKAAAAAPRSDEGSHGKLTVCSAAAATAV